MSGLDFGAVLAIGIHDMKNSLNRVLSSLDALSESCGHGESGQGESGQGEALAQLQYEARRMKDNLTKMLTIYRHDHGLYAPNFAPVDLCELLEDAWLNNKPLMDQYAIRCTIDCQPDLHWTLDPYLVTSLIENVLTNTLRYTKERVRLSARQGGDWLCLEVEDDGPGFPADMLGPRHLRDSSAPDAQLGNTGLGLHFCALVAERHRAPDGTHGRIELSNDGALGGGRFALRLPTLR